MPISPLLFLVDRTLALRLGADTDSANRDAILGSVVRPGALGVVLTAALARNQASNTNRQVTSTSGQTSTTGSSTPTAPTIARISPKTVRSNYHVTIAGTGFSLQPGQTKVFFGSTEAPDIDVMEDEVIAAQVPDLSAQTSTNVKVTVVVGGVPSNAFTLTIAPVEQKK